MNTYLVIEGQGKKRTYFVRIRVVEGVLSVQQVNGWLKTWSITIPLEHVQPFFIENFYGSSVVQFFYKSEKYTFLENGLGVKTYLYHHLYEKVSV